MGKRKSRILLHVDMNCFYASVEMAYDPSLKGKPVAIAGSEEDRRGIVVTCSYEARKFGVKTTMTVREAKRLCPQLIILPPNFERYKKASQAAFAILREYTDLVEPVSIDEGYLDITHRIKFEHPLETAKSIQNRLLDELDLPCSIGIAPNKFLAKTASDMKKPLGITILRKRDVPRLLWPLDIHEMHGIGERTAEKLKQIHIHTIGDLAKANDVQLRMLLGINGLRLKERANGNDDRPVDPESVYEFKSVGNSTTLPADSSDEGELLLVLDSLAETVSRRLANKRVFAGRIQVMIRYHDRKTVTRSEKTENPVRGRGEIFSYARKIFLKHWTGSPVRLLGITADELLEEGQAFKQLDLFTYEKEEKTGQLAKAIEKLKEKYGKNIIVKGMTDYNKEGLLTSSFSKDFLDESGIRK